MKSLNINSNVRIKLTPYGIEKIKKQYGKLYFEESIQPSADKDGFYAIQLWRLMNTFGEDMYMGNTNFPFDSNIEIDDAQLWSH